MKQQQPSRTHVTSVQFEPDGDVITADSDGELTPFTILILISSNNSIALRIYYCVLG
jgi:hypothetical protein